MVRHRHTHTFARVSDAYQKLQTLRVDAVNVTESGDEESSHRGEEQDSLRLCSAQPDALRTGREEWVDPSTGWRATAYECSLAIGAFQALGI